MSIVIPTFNSEPKKTLVGLKTIRDQVFNDYECLIIDDSSSNEVISLLKEFCNSDQRFFYIRGNSKGIANALNIGLSRARGKYIARADDTDICAPNRLLKQVELLEQNSSVDIVGSNAIHIYPNGQINQRRYPENHKQILKRFLIACPIAHSIVMFRRNIIDNGHSYDERFIYCEDLELWLRLYRSGYKFFNIQENFLKYEASPDMRVSSHYRYNFLARLKHSCNPLIFISCIFSLGHFLLPVRVKKTLFNTQYQRIK